MAFTGKLSLASLPSLGTIASTALRFKNEIQSKVQSALQARSTSTNSTTSPVHQPVRTVEAEPIELNVNEEVIKKQRKASPKRAKKDHAHAPGHRKLDLKSEFNEATGTKVKTQKSAHNRMAPADKIAQTQPNMRRMGAAAGRRRQGGSKAAHH